MSFTKNPSRLAGLLYLLGSIPGFFALMYVPNKLIVYGNTTATANNIAASETLLRLGIAADLILPYPFYLRGTGSVRCVQGRQPAARLADGDVDCSLDPNSISE